MGGSAFAASAGTLAAALAFRPLRDRLQAAVDRRFARRRVEAVRLLRDFLDDVRDGRSEPEEVGAALAIALEDPRSEVLFRLPETGAYADRHGHVLDALPEDGRARSAIGHDHREVGVLLHDPALAQRPDVLRGSSMPRRWRWSSAACGSSCASSSPRSSRRARGSRKPATRSAAGSSATCTTARSSGS